LVVRELGSRLLEVEVVCACANWVTASIATAARKAKVIFEDLFWGVIMGS
jgi:hypothetical protein